MAKRSSKSTSAKAPKSRQAGQRTEDKGQGMSSVPNPMSSVPTASLPPEVHATVMLTLESHKDKVQPFLIFHDANRAARATFIETQKQDLTAEERLNAVASAVEKCVEDYLKDARN